eukprot:tig00000691_g3151.t1
MTVEPLRQFARSSQAVLITASLLPLSSLPLNMGLLGLFTLCFGTRWDDLQLLLDGIVLEAVCLTAAIVVALTLYTFSRRSGRPSASLLLIAGFVQARPPPAPPPPRPAHRPPLTPRPADLRALPLFDFLLSVAGAVVFSLYIVYDTHRTMHVHSVDEYIMAVI